MQYPGNLRNCSEPGRTEDSRGRLRSGKIGFGAGQKFSRDWRQKPNDLAPDSDPEATYSYAVAALNAFNPVYLHVVEGATQGPRDAPNGFDLQILRRLFKGLYIANNGHDLALAAVPRPYRLPDADAGLAFRAPRWSRTACLGRGGGGIAGS